MSRAKQLPRNAATYTAKLLWFKIEDGLACFITPWFKLHGLVMQPSQSLAEVLRALISERLEWIWYTKRPVTGWKVASRWTTAGIVNMTALAVGTLVPGCFFNVSFLVARSVLAVILSTFSDVFRFALCIAMGSHLMSSRVLWVTCILLSRLRKFLISLA